MGVDLTFTLDHKLKNISMAEVSRRCDGMNDMFVEVARFWSEWYPHIGPPLQPWRDAGAFDKGQPFYQAPAGFFFTLGSAAVQIHHLCNFRFFTENLPARTMLRRFARRSCEILGGNRVIYAPDEGVGQKILDPVTDNRTVADIEGELLQISPPASTFEELNGRFNPPWTRPAYYVDTFEDLPLKVGKRGSG